MKSRTAQFFETKVRYHKIQASGRPKKVQEHYVVSAMTFAEAEGRITEEMSAYISGEFDVKAITPASYGEVFFSDDANDDRWYKTKVQFIVIDDRTDEEKRASVYYLVQGASLEKARKNLDKEMSDSMADYDIVSVVETKILDVFLGKIDEK